MDSSEQLAFYDGRYRANFERGMQDSYKFYDSYFRFVDARYSKLHGDGGRALDIGCGSGGVLKLLRERGYETFGLDFSEVAVNEIHSRNLAEVAVADVQEGIPFAGSYKLITAFEVIEHLYEPERALSHIRASLAPNGIWLATSPCPGTVTHPPMFRSSLQQSGRRS